VVVNAFADAEDSKHLRIQEVLQNAQHMYHAARVRLEVFLAHVMHELFECLVVGYHEAFNGSPGTTVGTVTIISRSIDLISWRLLLKERQLHELVAELHERLPHPVVQRKQLHPQLNLFAVSIHSLDISRTWVGHQ
jgi:hypothetical protein